MLLVYAVLAAAAVLANLSIRLMDVTQNAFLHILFGLVIAAFFVGIAAAVILTAVVMIGRFYRSLLKEQGYLMHTLPVTVHGHIWSKLIVSLVWFVATFVLVWLLILATVLIQSGTQLGDLFAGLPSLWKELLQEMQESGIRFGNMTVLGLEVIAGVILACLTLCLHFYAAMSLGQMFSKNQILLTIVFFIAINIVFNVLETVAGMSLLRQSQMFEVDTLPQILTAMQAAGGGALLLALIQGAILYVATFLPLKYRLNLA
jgi:hypothetical protein